MFYILANPLICYGSWYHGALHSSSHHQMETFSTLLALCDGNPLVAGGFPSQRPVRALIFSLICTWTNGWANNQNASDLRHHHTHYNITVMSCEFCYGFHPLQLHGYWHPGDNVMLNIGIAIMVFWLLILQNISNQFMDDKLWHFKCVCMKVEGVDSSLI